MKSKPPKMISISGLSLIRVRASLDLPAAFIPTMLVVTTMTMNRPLRAVWPAASVPGTRAVKYWAKATGNTERESHSASRSAHPIMKPGKGEDTAVTNAYGPPTLGRAITQ